MKSILFSLLVVLVALASVMMSEMTMFMWMSIMRFDATGNFFWAAVLPSQVIVVGFTTFVLMAVYKRKPRMYMPMYAIVFAVAHGVELNQLGNPFMDVATYVVSILIACAFWFALINRFYIQPGDDQTSKA
jgi:hypothetical protein